MFRAFVPALALVLTASSAIAGGLDPSSINDAPAPAKLSSSGKPDASLLKLQVLLDRAHFSPGEIDGRFGENARKALTAFAAANGMPFRERSLPKDLWTRLVSSSEGPALSDYQITEADTKGPFLSSMPAKMEDMQHLEHLNYTSPREALAEKFHMSEALLQAINPGKSFDKAGETIVVANVGPQPASMPITRIEVDKKRQMLSAFDADNKLLGAYPATVGSAEKPTPSGTLKVTEVDRNPTYRYNPAYRFKGVKATKPFTIRPGPNNPVGSIWINLSAEGYGIHGTPEPGKVSKSESHGCVRLTNWDAQTIGANVKRGTPVTFLEGSDEAAKPARDRQTSQRSPS